MTKRFTGKVALITASTAGIGLGIAHRLGTEGAKLVICSRKQDKVEETVQQLKSRGFEATGCAANVSKLEDIKKIVDLAVSSYGRIDVLVSNAAVNPAAGGILDIPDWAIDKLLAVNVKSAIQLVREAKPQMPAGSSIVMVSSYAAYNAEPPIALYGVTKTTVVALSKALANELGPEGIRVNCIAPGKHSSPVGTSRLPPRDRQALSLVKSGFKQQWLQIGADGTGVVPTKFAAALVANPEMEQLQKSRTWLGRLGTAEDMAAAVAYLASEDASYVTGETIVVAGGVQSRL